MTPSLPKPWPNPNKGLPVQQYTIHSQSIPLLTEFHALWYVWSSELTKFVKVLPFNVAELLNPLALALWIQDDGYWNNGVILCADNFTYQEVLLLGQILETNFSLLNTINIKTRSNGNVCWRLRISSKPANLARLRELVSPHFVPSMLYKLGLGEKS
jgi:hypothetical protein